MPVAHLKLQAFTLIAPTPCRADWIRTSDPYVPNVVRYRAALLPVKRAAKIQENPHLSKNLPGKPLNCFFS